MNDGYFVGPREIIFNVPRDFAKRIREEVEGGWFRVNASDTARILQQQRILRK